MRTVAEQTFTDEFFGSLQMSERLLWLGLILACADDQGRLIDNPILIRNAIFAFDEISPNQIDNMLEHFCHASKIIRYASESNGSGKKLIQIVNWWRYQRSASWAGRSLYPAPEGWIDRCRYHGKSNKIILENWEIEGGYSANLASAYLAPALPLGRREGEGEGEGEGEMRVRTTVPPTPSDAAEGSKKAPTQDLVIQGQGDELETQSDSDYAHSSSGAVVNQFMETSCNSRDCEQLYRNITDQITIPPDQKDKALQLLMIILSHYHGNIHEAEKAGSPIYDRWCATKSKTNKPYSRTNTNWLNWWLEELSPAKASVKALNITIPRPSILCNPGMQLWKKAEAAKYTGDGAPALQDYQDHITHCDQCNGSSNAKQVIGQISQLVSRWSV